MQNAETVLGVLRERGRRGLPCDELYRQLFNPQLYLLAYGPIYANQGAMTPGVTQETVDGMSQAKIVRIIDAMRLERYRFRPGRRVHISKQNGKTRTLGLPTWSEKLVGEVVRLLLDAYYEPTFSDHQVADATEERGRVVVHLGRTLSWSCVGCDTCRTVNVVQSSRCPRGSLVTGARWHAMACRRAPPAPGRNRTRLEGEMCR
ncbi:hypothetical protein [Pseudonocardia kunmingensis]|uniref:Reverse transcriptase (RNA-dependent DNA polymerase) n=1 Tax=Pseudonocardia kunmingensis TaxID=630975 RepID=A0A543DP06_9PSEU|nr:hypothetical protein [Pseudonocardia kunmingensis]TQM11061.1 hypothetical protein FB558_3602 [Pseudonocardia kunmingensis]